MCVSASLDVLRILKMPKLSFLRDWFERFSALWYGSIVSLKTLFFNHKRDKRRQNDVCDSGLLLSLVPFVVTVILSVSLKGMNLRHKIFEVWSLCP